MRNTVAATMEREREECVQTAFQGVTEGLIGCELNKD